MKTIILNSAFAFAVAVSGAGTAFAQPDVSVLGQRPDDEALAVRVGYGDLNFASANARDELTSRVRGAVRQVCAPLDEKARWVQHIECREVAWDNARPQMQQAFARIEQARLSGAVDTAAATIPITAPAL